MKPEEAAEQILVVPTKVVADCNGGRLFEGFWKGITPFERALDPAFHTFRMRGDLEQDPTWKQLIPYTIIRYLRLDGGTPWYLSYQRSSDQAEKRLAGLSSIGIGGHVTESDMEPHPDDTVSEPVEYLLNYGDHGNSWLWRGMVRELFEEIWVPHPERAEIVGLLNEEATDVGKVHLGIVVVVDVRSTTVDTKDPYVGSLRWMSAKVLQGHRNEYEGWSKHCIDAIIAGAIVDDQRHEKS